MKDSDQISAKRKMAMGGTKSDGKPSTPQTYKKGGEVTKWSSGKTPMPMKGEPAMKKGGSVKASTPQTYKKGGTVKTSKNGDE